MKRILTDENLKHLNAIYHKLKGLNEKVVLMEANAKSHGSDIAHVQDLVEGVDNTMSKNSKEMSRNAPENRRPRTSLAKSTKRWSRSPNASIPSTRMWMNSTRKWTTGFMSRSEITSSSWRA